MDTASTLRSHFLYECLLLFLIDQFLPPWATKGTKMNLLQKSLTRRSWCKRLVEKDLSSFPAAQLNRRRRLVEMKLCATLKGLAGGADNLLKETLDWNGENVEFYWPFRLFYYSRKNRLLLRFRYTRMMLLAASPPPPQMAKSGTRSCTTEKISPN